jgi:hypothetical protein
MDTMGEYSKRGYLDRDFMLFHLKDEKIKEYGFHYHDFNKIFILISGNVTYCIEGRTYELKPYDVILVSAGEIHRPAVRDGRPYERIIIYVSDQFLSAYSGEDAKLGRCFADKVDGEKQIVQMLPGTGRVDEKRAGRK